jgi:hypothetical protein
MNKLWIFEVWNIASPKTYVGCTKTVIQHDLQLVYISGMLQCVFSFTGLLFAYSREWGIAGFRKTTLEFYFTIKSLPIWEWTYVNKTLMEACKSKSATNNKHIQKYKNWNIKMLDLNVSWCRVVNPNSILSGICDMHDSPGHPR